MKEKDPPFRGLVLNINFPTCATGSVRGVRVVAVGRSSNVTAYTLISDVAGVQTWEATVVNGNFLAPDCTSTLEDPQTDLEAFNNGFAVGDSARRRAELDRPSAPGVSLRRAALLRRGRRRRGASPRGAVS